MNNINALNTASTHVNTSAYVTLVASTSIPFTNIFATDTTGKILKLAVGSAGNEIDICQLPSDDSQIIPMPSINTVPAGSRLSLRAMSANATSGYSVVTLLS